jgi:hypothetical protein
MSELREEVKENAEARMKRGLILMEVAKAEEITIPNEEINQRVQQTIQEIAAYYSEEEAEKFKAGQNLENLKTRIASDEIISRTLKKLRDIAMGITEEDKSETADETSTEPGEEVQTITQEVTEATVEETSSDEESSSDEEIPDENMVPEEVESEEIEN